MMRGDFIITVSVAREEAGGVVWHMNGFRRKNTGKSKLRGAWNDKGRERRTSAGHCTSGENGRPE